MIGTWSWDTKIPRVTSNWIFWEEMNVFVDNQAKEARLLLEVRNESTFWDPILPHEMWRLEVQGRKIAKNVVRQIYNHVSCKRMRHFWNRHNRTPKHLFSDVAWEAIAGAMKLTKPGRRQWITKHATGFCGVNSTLVVWKDKEDPACVRCGQEETTVHVW